MDRSLTVAARFVAILLKHCSKPLVGRAATVVVAVMSMVIAGTVALGVQPESMAKSAPDAGVTRGEFKGLAEVRIHAAPKPLPLGAVTHDWPAFHGPTHDAVSTETKLLRRFPSGGPAVVWEMETGAGYAAPAVVGDRLVFFHRIGDEEIIECLQAGTGKRNWAYRYPATYRDRYGFGNGPRCSPVIDEGRVFTYGADGMLHCLNLKTGTAVWMRDLSTEFKVPRDFFGVTSTPLVEQDVLVVQVGAPGGPSVVGFDKRTGKTVWSAGDRWGPSCASPVPAEVNGKRRVFLLTGGDSRPPMGGLLAIDPRDGTIDFRFPFRSRIYQSINAADPVIVGPQVFLTSAYRTGGVLLNMRSEGGVEVAWKSDALRSHFATPIHRDGFLYGFDGSNKAEVALVCVELSTGKRLWRVQPEWEELIERNGRKQTVTLGMFRGSLLWVDGRFLCLGEMGHLLWLDLSPEGYTELSRARLFLAEESWTMPVLSRGLLYVTQNAADSVTKRPPRLICYDLRAKE